MKTTSKENHRSHTILVVLFELELRGKPRFPTSHNYF